MNATHDNPILQRLASQGISPVIIGRFFKRIRFTASCWIWTYTKKGNYGIIKIPMVKKAIRAHRLSWILHFGPIPQGKDVLHDCPDGDNPSCVNPAHLWLGTQSENSLDMWRKGRGPVFKTADISGENARNRKLNWKTVRRMRRLFKTTAMTIEKIAKTVGITKTNAHRIIHGLNWIDPEYSFPKATPIKVRDSPDRRGELTPTAKLTNAQAKEIRLQYKTGRLTQAQLAKKYGVHQSCICNVCRHKSFVGV